MGPAYFFIQMFWNNLFYLMFKKYSEIVFAADLLAKINWEVIELFGDIYQIVKMETTFPQNY